jgi:glutathione synthase/RimK-type ligase-like ATP-grasp enzyme
VPTRETYPVHPDNGAAIEGRRVPCWTEAKSLAEDCVTAFPELRFAGLDIAIGVDGPVVIEMNVFPDREGAAFVDMPTATILAG